MTSPDQQKRITAVLKKELEERGLRPLLYRIDNDMVTVALLLKKGTQEPVARGVSIQSPTDQPYRKDGNNRAIGRALKAVRLEASGSPIQPFARDAKGNPTMELRKPHLHIPWMFFKNKRTYMPALTIDEQELLKKIKV